jgi:hypothetical protein
MNLRRAATYLFADRSWPRKVGLIALVSPVPVFGQMYALGYANLTLRRMLKGNGDSVLPEAKLGWELCLRGIKVMLATLLCAVIITLLGAPLFLDSESTATTVAPALVQSLQGPSSLLVTCVSSVVTAIVLARFALTGSFGSGFNPIELWSLLRAEPAIWICYAVVGYLFIEGPYALVWVLPLRGGWDIAGTVIACSVLWTYGLMINTHLIGQAFHWSRRTAALRAAQVRYRW